VNNKITVVPMPIKARPLPHRTLVGDLSRTDKVLIGLDLADRPVNNAHQPLYRSPVYQNRL
jgi:hypothetical protein